MNNEDRKEAERLADELFKDECNGYGTKASFDAVEFLRRLAAQPAQVPMTYAGLVQGFNEWIAETGQNSDLVNWVGGFRSAEAHHGIKGEGRKGERKCV